MDSIAPDPTLLQQVMQRHNITRKELAEALEIPASALGSKKVARYAVPLLEEWLKKPPAPLSEVDDVMLESLNGLLQELAERRKLHERGRDRAQATMERVNRLFWQHMHALNRLRLEKKALKQMMEAAGEAPFAERYAELLVRENNLETAIKRNSLAAYMKASLRLDMHVMALESLDAEEENYRKHYKELHQYLREPKTMAQPISALAPLLTPELDAASEVLPQGQGVAALKTKPITNDFSDILAQYGPEDLDDRGRPLAFEGESRDAWKLRIRPYVDAVRKTNKKK